MDKLFDVAIIGGGINGAAIAADAALRGLSVVLLEKDDLASKTSSSSSKLIHGGLRYLEQYDFSMVKKALTERQRLVQRAPHLVHPYPFVLPYEPSIRPFWFLKAGLMLYDNLSRENKLPKSKAIKRKHNADYFSPLNSRYNKGYIYYDCITDDSRLTISNALQAQEHQALICPHAQLLHAICHQGIWHLDVIQAKGLKQSYRCRAVVNAAGPWVNAVNELLGIPNAYALSLVKGSHLLLKKLYEGDYAYLFQHKDKRIIFVVPFQGYSMVGTTDVLLSEKLGDLSISKEETDYLLEVLHQYLPCEISKKQIVGSWSGIRTLLANESASAQTLSRDFAFHFSPSPAPVVTVYSGKLTTARQLAEEVVDSLKSVFPFLQSSTTAHNPLPGGALEGQSFSEFCQHAQLDYPWLDKALLQRYLNSYGTNTSKLLEGCHSTKQLGIHFGAGLYQCEVDYLCEHEWAGSAEDILWRRTKLGLAESQIEIPALNTYLGR